MILSPHISVFWYQQLTLLDIVTYLIFVLRSKSTVSSQEKQELENQFSSKTTSLKIEKESF